MGVEPGQATTAAYAAVLDSPRDTTVVSRRPPVRARPGLVGREEEWQQLVAAWGAAEHGPPSVVLVTGEPEIGKTRLVDELRAWCTRADAAVGEARSYATEGDLGYGVVASWLRSPDVEAGLRQLPPNERAELARLLPELGSPAPVQGADDAGRRRRLFDAATLALMGTGQPTLLIADDCQWSDQVSQEFIHYLVRQRIEVPLLVVLTARREELDMGHPVALLRDALVVLDRLSEVRLERLSREATGELGSQLTGSRLDERAIETLFAETEGNPLFVVETVRGASEVVEHARVVIGADGHNSRVARAVDAGRYHAKPVLENAFYTYWRGLPVDAFTTVVRGDRGFAAIPTNDDLTLVLVGCPFAHASEFRRDVEASYFEAIKRDPEWADRLSAATREERFTGGGVPNFFRKPAGEPRAAPGRDAGAPRCDRRQPIGDGRVHQCQRRDDVAARVLRPRPSRPRSTSHGDTMTTQPP